MKDYPSKPSENDEAPRAASEESSNDSGLTSLGRFARRGFLVHAASLPALYWAGRAFGQPMPPSNLTVDGQITPPPPPPVGGPVDVSIVPPLGRTVWNPGLYQGIPADDASGRADGVGGCTQHGATISAGASLATIQAALDAAAAAASASARKFVKLGAGVFTLSGKLHMPSYVTLRGTINADGFTRGTIIRNSHDGGLIDFQYNSELAQGNWGTILSVSPNVAKNETTITVNNAASIRVGDIIKIDTIRDGQRWGALVDIYNPPNNGDWCWPFDTRWFIRKDYNSQAGGAPDEFPNAAGEGDAHRHISETKEVLAKNGNTLTIYDANAPVLKGAPMRSPMYKTPQVYRCAAQRSDVRRYSGIEDLKLEPSGVGNGRTPIEIDQAAFCWIKNVEIDGEITRSWNGRILRLGSQTYRCEITGCYFHGSSNYTPGANAYGVSIAGSDHYIHNNVSRKLNKPITFEGSCGGNVVAYNYVDEAIIGLSDSWQEAGISSHASFCHYELIEGNHAPNVGADGTHGNNGWFTMFRNYCRGLNGPGAQTGPLRCISVEAWQREMYSIGNVLLDPALVSRVDALIESKATNGTATGGIGPAVYLLGFNALTPLGLDGNFSADDWDNGQTARLFHRHLDFDAFSNSQYNNATNPVKTLPDSLHRASPPDYFTRGGYAWPWVNPAAGTHAARVLTLPAKARYDAGRA